ncbi:acyl-ACP thioesterase domain-containing protein [Facklamia languida]|uniref:Acyl-ACP thioesterase n=1 Tax=Facklamia languida CCUG 37842 TaxID=883113 RepID=H3NI53_9LACT|nr:acyl-ACP thioesterase domain-containing protein [Facklamia languida]EHR37852.1 hypothetical protein HMPREF9708_00481 [Facklamia languida CCUG 37842]
MEGRIDQSFSQMFLIDSNFFKDKTSNSFNYDLLISKILETSTNHDRCLNDQLGAPFLPDDLTWIITQNMGQIIKVPDEGKYVVIETRVSKANRFFVNRWFGIWQSSQLVMEFQIQFAALNLLTRRMVTIPYQKLEVYCLVDKRLDQNFKRVLESDHLSLNNEENCQIGEEDIDNNQHVNNLVYIRWAFQAMDQLMHPDYQLKQISIKYGHEILPDHQVKLLNYLDDSKKEADHIVSVQTFLNQTTQEEACRVVTKWCLAN